MTHPTLADSLEAGAVEMQRELLDQAYKALHPEPPCRRAYLGNAEWQGWADGYNRFFAKLKAEAYVDAAMMLVPEGWGWTIGDKSPMPSIAWCEIEGLPWKAGYGWAVERRLMVEAATPALALAAAALRAHSTDGENSRG